MYQFSTMEVRDNKPAVIANLAYSCLSGYLYVSEVWDTRNKFRGYQFPVLQITVLPHGKTESETEIGKMREKLELSETFECSPRDMLAVLSYLEEKGYGNIGKDFDIDTEAADFAERALVDSGFPKDARHTVVRVVTPFMNKVLRDFIETKGE